MLLNIQDYFLRLILKSGLTELESISIIRLFAKLVSKRIMPKYQQFSRGPLSPVHSSTVDIIIIKKKIFANLIGVKCYFIVILMYHSLITSEGKHFPHICWLVLFPFWKLPIHIHCEFIHRSLSIIKFHLINLFIYKDISTLSI